MKRLVLIPTLLITFAMGQATDLFFSEYAEGSSSNKYVEIYNGTSADVDLSSYSVQGTNNGTAWGDGGDRDVTLSGTLISGDVFVLAADAADAIILAETDLPLAYESPMHHNGDDGIALLKNGAIIDAIGVENNDPGSGWDVAGTTNATKDHTLVRKSTVTSGNTDWSASAGTDADDSEWIVLALDTWDYLGSHPHTELEVNNPEIAITSPTDGSTTYSTDVTVSFTVSNFTVATSGSDGHVHYSVDGGSTVMVYTTDDIALTALSESSHTIIMWLVDDSHANLSTHVADTVTFTVAAAPNVTSIYDIQYATTVGTGTNDCYTTVYDDSTVTVSGIVTAVKSGSYPNFWVQDGDSLWSGIYVYDTSVNPTQGDSITLTCEVDEYNGLSELKNIALYSIDSSSVRSFDPISVTTGELGGGCSDTAEAYEGLLVKLTNVTVTQAADSYGQWFVDDGSGEVEIEDDFIDPDDDLGGVAVGDFYSEIIGVVDYSYGEYEVTPRSMVDLVTTDVGPTLVSVSFDPTFPVSGEDVAVTAFAYDDQAGLVCSLATSLNDAAYSLIGLTDNSDSTYTGAITGQTEGDTVDFYISLVDVHGNSAMSDTFSVTFEAAETITAIYDVQYTTDTSGDSPLDGSVVTISGIVTAEFWGGYNERTLFVQDSAGPWNGVMVYEYGGWDNFDFESSAGTVHSVAEGDSVTVTGTVDEYYGVTEIKNISSFKLHGAAMNMIAPDPVTPAQVSTGGSLAEAYEGCLVGVANVTVASDSLGNGEWSVTDGTDTVRVDDNWDYYFWPTAGDSLSEVVGVLDYSYSNTKIQPRLARDVVETTGNIRIQRIQQVLYSDLLKTPDDEYSDSSYVSVGGDNAEAGVGEAYTVTGIVTMPTGLSYAGDGIKFIFADESGGPWSGIMSYDPDSSTFPVLFEGDEIELLGRVGEYRTDYSNMTEFWSAGVVDIISAGNELPEGGTVTTGDLRLPATAEQWGTVMVYVEDATVTQPASQYEIFGIDDGSGFVWVDDDSDSLSAWIASEGTPPVGTLLDSIRGWPYHHYGSYTDSSTYKLEPLYGSDIIIGSGPPNIISETRSPCAPGTADDVTITAEISDNSTVASATLYYRVDGGTYTSVAMTASGTSYSGTIPATGTEGADVDYYIEAIDDGVGQSGVDTSHSPYNPAVENFRYPTIDGDYSIMDVQYTPWQSGDSPLYGCTVSLTGVVTMDSSSNSGLYAMQDAEDQWGGIFYESDSAFTVGDSVTITGMVEEYDDDWHFKWDNLTKITDVSTFTVHSSGHVIESAFVGPADLNEDDGDEVESYEGVQVELTNVIVSVVNSYDWTVQDAAGNTCLIDDDWANADADNYMAGLVVGDSLESVSGIFNFSFGTYKLQVRSMADIGEILGNDPDFVGTPFKYQLHQNYPNPFNPETRIRFEIGGHEDVTLVIYDILGRRVRVLLKNASYRPGMHVLNWNGQNDSGEQVASGVYFYIA
jgi:predicted extracellular nuclease